VGFQPSCSESVYQICGVDTDAGEKIKESFISLFKNEYENKYTEQWLEKELQRFLEIYFTKDTEYHLNWVDLDDAPYGNILIKAAEEHGYINESVSETSDAIISDDEMVYRIEMLKEYKQIDT